jgi:hypothetical protein
MGKKYFLRRLQRPSLNNSRCGHSAFLCKTGKTTQKGLLSSPLSSCPLPNPLLSSVSQARVRELSIARRARSHPWADRRGVGALQEVGRSLWLLNPLLSFWTHHHGVVPCLKPQRCLHTMDTLRRLAIVGSRSASLGKVEERERTEAKERGIRGGSGG